MWPLPDAHEASLEGATLHGAVRLHNGYNLVSLHLDADSAVAARAFAARLGVSALVRHDPVTGVFESFLPAFSPGDGFPILGGAAYFALSKRDTTVIFAGKGWHGRQPRFAPPVGKTAPAQAQARVLAVTRDPGDGPGVCCAGGIRRACGVRCVCGVRRTCGVHLTRSIRDRHTPCAVG